MSDQATALAQIIISVLFILGYFSVLLLFLLGYVQVPVDYKEAFSALLGVLSAAIVQQVSYWFSRQRGSNAT
jgi:protein-S-isoprenylcysteine O-methyltransferase Ste14